METPLCRELKPLPWSVNLHPVTQVFHHCLCKAPLALAIQGECVYRGELCPPRTAILGLQETVATKLTSRSWCREGCVRSGLFWNWRCDEETEMWRGKNWAYFGAFPSSESSTRRTPPSAIHPRGRSRDTETVLTLGQIEFPGRTPSPY